MVPSLRNLIYKERLERLDLLSLKENRERDLIAVYMIVKETDKVDQDDLFVRNIVRQEFTAKNKETKKD